MNRNRIFMLIFALISFTSVNCFAQMSMGGGPGGGGQMGGGPGGGGRGGGDQMGGPPRQEASVDIVASTGLFIYDIEEAIKSSKIKDTSKDTEIKIAFAEYYSVYEKTTMEFQGAISELKQTESDVMAMREGGNYTGIRERMSSAIESMTLIRDRMLPAHVQFKEAVAALLSDKDKRRWNSYYEKLCSENSFRMQEGGGRGERPEGGRGERPARPEDESENIED